MPPAARVTDMHVCPMVTGIVPHVGGPILPPSSVNVLIGGLPAARVTDMLTCVGPPDIIVKGSLSVLINNLPAARMGDITVHGGTIVLGCFTVMIGDAPGGGGMGGGGGMAVPPAPPTAPSAGPGAGGKAGATDDLDSLVKLAPGATAADAELVKAELRKMPREAIAIMKKNGTKVVVTRGSVTGYRADLKGVTPRGWPPGSTWDTVPGAYFPDKNEVVIGVVGHGTPAGAHVPKSGEGHGSSNLVIHESMHSVDAKAPKDQNSSSKNFNAARNKDIKNLPAYETQPGTAGQEESYAESAARHYGGDPDSAKNTPNLDSYWANNPFDGK